MKERLSQVSCLGITAQPRGEFSVCLILPLTVPDSRPSCATFEGFLQLSLMTLSLKFFQAAKTFNF